MTREWHVARFKKGLYMGKDSRLFTKPEAEALCRNQNLVVRDCCFKLIHESEASRYEE